MNCNQCGGRLTVVQHDGRWRCSHCHAHGEAHSPAAAAADPASAHTARKLVFWSHILGWGGLAVLLVGSVMGGRLAGGTGAAIGAGIGIVSAVTGALLGQVGRGMQGRVI